MHTYCYIHYIYIYMYIYICMYTRTQSWTAVETCRVDATVAQVCTLSKARLNKKCYNHNE